MVRSHYGLEHVLMVPEPHLARYPLTEKSRARLREMDVRIMEVPWLHPPLTESVLHANVRPQ